jgi:hypothetical protein
MKGENNFSGERMITNLDRYKSDLDKLISKGNKLHIAIQLDCFPKQMKKQIKDQFGEKADKILDDIPSFKEEYQVWYSEAQALIKQLLPDRLQDFIRYYEKPKGRKEISFESYRIEDYLQGLTVTRGYPKDVVVGPDAAIPHFRQQLAILASVKERFESSLFNISELVQADLFDSELDAAKELSKKKFARAAGALAGVVLERHLSQVCENHNIRIRKKAPGISDLNGALKENNVIEIPDWRFIQHLADIRNLCDHNKDKEPSVEQVDDLIAGVMKVIKTIF